MTEKEIETQILTWLNLQKGIFAFKVNTMGVFDPTRQVFRRNTNRFIMNGCSDILGIAYGQFIAIECKTPTALKRFLNRPTPSDQRQQLFLNHVQKHGGCSTVVSSLEQVIKWVSLLRQKSNNIQ